MTHSKIIRRSPSGWQGITPRKYKNDGSLFKDIQRFSLLGEGENEQELNFHTRYFEIQAGGYSTLEYHRHPHTVIIVKGLGSLILGNQLSSIQNLDVIYIAPETLHQFHADQGEALGFLCIVDRYRDRPTLPNRSYIENHITDKAVLDKIKY